MAWAAPDEVDSYADAAMEQARQTGGVVPSIWFLEVANTFVMIERKNRLGSEEVAKILAGLAALSLAVDGETAARALVETAVIARKHRLSVYDAAYLELALRLRRPIASLDGDLMAAAKAEGVAWEH